MSVAYTDSFLYPRPGFAISMRSIESMEFQTEEGQTIDKLKGDVTIKIVTSSGRDYEISALSHFKSPDKRIDPEQYAQGIYERWRFLLRE